MKTCRKCLEELPLDQFNVWRNGLRSRCKRCMSDQTLAWYYTNREATLIKMRDRAKKRYVPHPREAPRLKDGLWHCKGCAQHLPLDKFTKQTKDGKVTRSPQWLCKKCKSKYMAEWFKRHPEKNKEYMARHKKRRNGLIKKDELD